MTTAESSTEMMTMTQTTGLKIRPAHFGDMEQIADFVRSSAEWYREIVSEDDMGEHDVDHKWAVTNFARRLFYIGSADGEDIGTISLQYFGEYAYLGYIYLDVKHVGKGYGQELMDFAAEKARAEGMKGLALIAHPEATWAKKAYLKYGFDIVETEKDSVLEWQDGALKPYYEEGFELYIHDFEPVSDDEPEFELVGVRVER